MFANPALSCCLEDLNRIEHDSCLYTGKGNEATKPLSRQAMRLPERFRSVIQKGRIHALCAGTARCLLNPFLKFNISEGLVYQRSWAGKSAN